MFSKKLISCVVLTCDSQENKGFSLLHTLAALMNQKFDDFEIIVVENSRKKPRKTKDIKSFLIECNKDREVNIGFKIIENDESWSVGKARNIGVDNSEGKFILFIDDDTILTDNNTLSNLSSIINEYDYGYGANRLWTKSNFFQLHSKKILDDVRKKQYSSLKKISGVPKKGIRENEDIEILKFSFIGNFGFVRKRVFEKVGGFPDFQGYGFEDDFLMFKLFEANYRYRFINEITVVHINHGLGENARNEIRTLLDVLNEYKKKGYYWFHVSKTFCKNLPDRSDILEKLKPVHYDSRVEDAYNLYIKKIPLHIEFGDKKGARQWQKDIQYNKKDFCRILDTLTKSSDINTFVQRSCGDFDNLAPLIESAIETDLIKIFKTGKIKRKIEFKFTQPHKPIEHKVDIIPNSEHNQFPCDEESINRRLDLLKERYPFSEYLSMAIIGDDDMLSSRLVNEYWVDPIILEKDPQIIEKVNNIPRDYNVLEIDVKNVRSIKNMYSVNTFITDPPYTYNGSLAFIYSGLNFLIKNNEVKEFYVILNSTIMGKKLDLLEKTLTNSGIFLKEVRYNFSQYRLPKHFDENKRALQFINNKKVDSSSLNYSSSSNLYMFECTLPDLKKIKRSINYSNIYIY